MKCHFEHDLLKNCSTVGGRNEQTSKSIGYRLFNLNNQMDTSVQVHPPLKGVDTEQPEHKDGENDFTAPMKWQASWLLISQNLQVKEFLEC